MTDSASQPPPAKPSSTAAAGSGNESATDVWTVRRVLEWTTGHLKKHGGDTPRLEAEILLAHAANCTRIQLYTRFDEPLTDAVRGRMRELVQRRVKAEPVAYLVGFREFFSLNFRVTPAVLIPRPDTETLVVAALDFLKSWRSSHPDEPLRVIELGTGSGCLAVSIAKNQPQAQVLATDLSPTAIAIATENAATHKLQERITFTQGDLFAALPDSARGAAVLVTNPPYVPTAEIETLDADVKDHEPRSALDGGVDGLDLVRRIIAEAPDWLAADGCLLCEFSPEQAAAVEALAQTSGHYRSVTILKDAEQRPRALRAVR